MFRTASRLPRRTVLLSATVAVTLHDPKEKLSIYASPDAEVLLVNAPLALEKEIGDARRQVLGAYADAHAHIQGWVSKWIGVEHAFESRVKAIVAPDEAVTPGLLYAGVAGLTGSILARNRILPTRLLLPPVFLVFAANYFLPKTTGNLSAYLGSLEDKYLPEVSHTHDIAKAHSVMAWDRLRDATANGRAKLDQGASLAVDKVQEATGLKLKETLVWQRAKVEEVGKRMERGSVRVREVAATEIKEVEEKAAAKVENLEEKAAATVNKVEEQATAVVDKVEEKITEKADEVEEKVEKVEEKEDEEPKRLV